MMGRLRHLFDALRRRRGEWTLFAVMYRGRRELRPWDLIVAAPWFSDAHRTRDRGEIVETLREVSSIHEMADLGMVLMLIDPADVETAARTLLNGRTIDHPIGLVRRKNFTFGGQLLRRGYIWAANLPEPAAVPAA